LVFGEFAEEGILASARVVPKKLLENGFNFRFLEITEAFADVLQNL
jgi:NAD dependent epimerase/dehydratase family enzyme